MMLVYEARGKVGARMVCGGGMSAVVGVITVCEIRGFFSILTVSGHTVTPRINVGPLKTVLKGNYKRFQNPSPLDSSRRVAL